MSSSKTPDREILKNTRIESFVEYWKDKKCKNVIILTGAGISTSAGIPDFRSPKSGLYANLEQYDLPYPEAIFDIDYFRTKPEPFFKLAKELYPTNFKPTPSHYFIKLLADKGWIRRVYTQNIDGLERLAGLNEDLVMEAHGSFLQGHCLDCNQAYQQVWLKEKIESNMVICEKCTGLVKPDIVFFGEALPKRFHQLALEDFPACDLLIVMGTSLKVQPFSSLIDHVKSTVPRLLINREIVGVHEKSTIRGFDFRGKKHAFQRDAVYLGDCDEGCRKLAKLLDLEDELDQLYNKASELDELAKAIEKISLSETTAEVAETTAASVAKDAETTAEDAEIKEKR